MSGIQVLYSFVFGFTTGLLSWLWSARLIESRSTTQQFAAAESGSPKQSTDRIPSVLAWVTFSISLHLIVGFIPATWQENLIVSLFILILLALSRVDWLIRKIPNPTLLGLIVVRLADLIIRQDFALVGQSLAGLGAGFILFQLPTLTGRTIGWGDVKLAAVIGFCLGWQGLLYSLAFMSLAMGLFSLLLILTKHGNLKSKIAIGPFMSIGMIISVLIDRF